jgi:hypothetical protein
MGSRVVENLRIGMRYPDTDGVKIAVPICEDFRTL